MANKPELQQCEGTVRSGKRCARKGTFKRKKKVTKKVWLFFTREEVVDAWYCTQHKTKK